MIRILFATGALVGAAACGGSDDDSSEAPDATSASAEDLATGDALDAPALAVEETAETVPADDGEARGVPASALDPGFGLDAIGRDLAIEVTVTMTSDDLRTTVDGIRRAAARAGGGVVAADVVYGPDGGDPGAVPGGRAVLVVKVPPAALDTVLGGLDDLGSVTEVGQDAEDVTDRLVDLDVRIRTQTELVERIRGLLDATTDLEQVIRLEGELTARQTELERLLATQQQLEERVALSTVTITVEPAPLVVAPVDQPADDGGLAGAFATGWDAFVAVVFGVGFVLAVLAPFLAVAAVAGGVLWAVVRTRSSRRERQAAEPGGDVDEASSDAGSDAISEAAPVSATPRG
jgi:hypothetical protein